MNARGRRNTYRFRARLKPGAIDINRHGSISGAEVFALPLWAILDDWGGSVVISGFS
jgi:hypothetical protein